MSRKKRYRGHYCWMCGRIRANEKFTGKGHRLHLCKDCARRPKAERERISAALEIDGFMRQRNISARNIARLEKLCHFPEAGVRRHAKLVLAIARVKPHKRKRATYLGRHRAELNAQLAETGFHDEADAEAYCPLPLR